MEEKDAQITVVVVVHNAEIYVERCLNSLINQDSQQFCVILVDDGSSDHSQEICRTAVGRMGKIARLIELLTVVWQKPATMVWRRWKPLMYCFWTATIGWIETPSPA